MTVLAWTDELRLDQPQMDQTHAEFVELLVRARVALQSGAPSDALATFERLLDHTVDHFAREERWMAAIGFPPDNAHAMQHQAVLQLMRDVLRHAREHGRCESLSVAINELGQWFPLHARMMDADLAMCMKKVGFDPASGKAREPATGEALTGCCGSASCGS